MTALFHDIPRADRLAAGLYRAGGSLVKAAGDAVKSYGLAGRLYKSQSGWILLAVPAAIVRGAFDALHEVGAELPAKDGRVEGHISVMSPADLAAIGRDTLDEVGHTFRYSLGPVREVEPDGQGEFDKCWFIECTSPELEKLRKSYGLSARPNDDKYQFHCTFAYRRRKVTRPGAAVVKQSDLAGLLKAAAQRPFCPGCGGDQTRISNYSFDEYTCSKCGKVFIHPEEEKEAGWDARITEALRARKSQHYRVECSCGKVVASCRCAGPGKEVLTVPDSCKDCRGKAPEKAAAEKERPFTVAVDLDGTLLEAEDPPAFGSLRAGAKAALEKFRAKGWRVIIWTVRGDAAAVEKKLTELGVPFDHINTNPSQPKDGSNKIIADLYLDDRAVNAQKSWTDIVNDVETAFRKRAAWGKLAGVLRSSA